MVASSLFNYQLPKEPFASLKVLVQLLRDRKISKNRPEGRFLDIWSDVVCSALTKL